MSVDEKKGKVATADIDHVALQRPKILPGEALRAGSSFALLQRFDNMPPLPNWNDDALPAIFNYLRLLRD